MKSNRVIWLLRFLVFSSGITVRLLLAIFLLFFLLQINYTEIQLWNSAILNLYNCARSTYLRIFTESIFSKKAIIFFFELGGLFSILLRLF